MQSPLKIFCEVQDVSFIYTSKEDIDYLPSAASRLDLRLPAREVKISQFDNGVECSFTLREELNYRHNS